MMIKKISSFPNSESHPTLTQFCSTHHIKAQNSENPVELKYYLVRKTQLASKADYFLNLHKLLYDREIKDIHNTELLRKVNNSDWLSMSKTHKQFDKEIASYKSQGKLENSQKLLIQKQLWENFEHWMQLLLESKDAQHPQGKQLIKSRVANLYLIITSTSDENRNELLEVIPDKRRKYCSDGAVAGLERAETLAMLIKSDKKLMINLFVLAFKKHLIIDELVTANNESAESYLYYTLLLNEALMLKTYNQSMHFSHIAVKYPLSAVLDKIFKRMTVKGLIEFISNNTVFQKITKQEKNIDTIAYLEKHEKLRSEIANLDPQDPNLESLCTDYQKLSDNFYAEQAKKLLIQKGFITKNVSYKDPSSFPHIHTIALEEERSSFQTAESQQKYFMANCLFLLLFGSMIILVLFILPILQPYFPDYIEART